MNHNAEGTEKPFIPSCTFCNASIENGFNIVYEDDSLMAFEDRKPASLYHFLVIPKRHIESVRSLERPDVELVQKMESVGHTLLSNFGIPLSMQKMGFHIPPFNSVYHLHLHVQGLPYLSNSRARQYPVSPGNGGYSKGLSWFVDVQQTVEILQRGKRVGVLPC